MQPYRFLWFDKLTNQACRKAGYGLTQLSHSSALNRSPKHLKMLSTKTQCLCESCGEERVEGSEMREGPNGRRGC